MKFEKVMGAVFIFASFFSLIFNIQFTGAAIGNNHSNLIGLVAMIFLVIGLALFISEKDLFKSKRSETLRKIKNSSL